MKMKKNGNNFLEHCSNKKNKIDEMMEENQNQMMIFNNNFLTPCSNKKKKIEKESGEITLVSTLTQSFPDASSKNVYICFAESTNGIDSVIFYKVNPSNSTRCCSNEENIPCITSVCSIPLSQVGCGFTPASIGSKLYIIGGGHPTESGGGGSKDVYCIDTQDEILVPRKLEAGTLSERRGSGVVYTHDKIFVFGGITWKPEPWGEVFDPNLNQWSPLPKPPNQLLKGYGNIVRAVSGDKIFILYKENLATFDLKTNSWDLIFNSLASSNKWYTNGTIADDILFMYDPVSVICYDLVENKWFKEPVRGLELDSMSCSSNLDALIEGTVVHLGEHYLCVIWRDITEGTRVQCVKFRVSRIYDAEKEEEVLQAEVQARSAYRILSGGCYMVDCIPM